MWSMWPEFAVLFAGFLLMVTWLVREHRLGARDRTFGSLGACLLLVSNACEAAHAPGHEWVFLATGVMLAIALPAATYRWWSITRRRKAGGIDPLAATDANSQGSELLARFDRIGDAAALAAGIDEFRAAVAATTGRPQHGQYVGNLILALLGRYQRLGQVADLDEAITIGEPMRLAAATGTGPTAELVPLLSALRLRYECQGNLADLDEAIRLGLRLTEGRSGRGRLRATVAEEVSTGLAARYLRTDDRADLRQAIALREQVLSAARWNRRRRGIQYASLCNLHALAADDSRRLLDIEQAIAAGRRAVALLHRRDRWQPAARTNLCLALRRRHRRRGDPADLDEAIEHARLAVALDRDDDPERARHRCVLAVAVYDRYRRTERPDELRAALDFARAAAAEPHLPLTMRVPLGLAWADMAAEAGRRDEAVRAFEQVIGLLPLLVPRDLARDDQEYQLGRWAGIAAVAASCTLADEQRAEPDRALTAVRLLEAGRGVLLSQALALRTGLATLRDREPRLADRFAALRMALAEPAGTSTAEGVAERERVRAARRALATELDGVLKRIRDHTGLTGLGTTPSRSQLLAQSAAGPIIVVNFSRHTSHAVLITPDDLRSVPLPGLTPQAFADHVSLLFDATERTALTNRDRQQPLFDVLAWLWDTIAGPVLGTLDPRDKPRVWWMPTGPLALLPIHAAGYHDTRDDRVPRTVLDRVVSSYTPTLAALADARTRAPAGGTPGPLVVAMPNTPGATPLPAAAQEADLIHGLFPGSLVLRDAEATSARVRTELGGRAWTHLACHTELVYRAPSNSRVLLHDHEQRSFTISDIAALELPKAELAYLSSCNTARAPAKLVDESVHLAAAFLLAGFPQVIGSIWPVNDTVAFKFTTTVYGMLRATAPGQAPAAAPAAHEATLQARKDYPNLPALWCGQLHLGR